MAPVEHGDEEVERVVQLMNDLARPFFVLRAAHGLIRSNITSVLPGAASQSQGAHTRQRMAIIEITEIIDRYAAGGEDDKRREDAGVPCGDHSTDSVGDSS